MTKDSKDEADKLTTNESSREITADELNQVTGGLGPILIFRTHSLVAPAGIPGESPDDPHKDW